jgi:hypothetical protein
MSRSVTSSSTSSSWVSRKLRYASARRKAVTAKVMTMAVSTMACGRGSLKPAGSPDPMMGGVPR